MILHWPTLHGIILLWCTAWQKKQRLCFWMGQLAGKCHLHVQGHCVYLMLLELADRHAMVCQWNPTRIE